MNPAHKLDPTTEYSEKDVLDFLLQSGIITDMGDVKKAMSNQRKKEILKTPDSGKWSWGRKAQDMFSPSTDSRCPINP